MSSKALVSGLLLLSALIWGGSFIVVKAATETLDPLYLGAVRFLVATPIMVLLLFATRAQVRLPRKEWPWIVVLGLTGVTFLYVLQYIGIAMTNASTSSLLTDMDVLFIALFSILFLREPMTRLRVIGILFSFVGVIVVVLANLDFSSVSVSEQFLFGSLLVISSSLCWGVFSIVGKRLMQTYSEITITTYAFLIGTVCYLPLVGGSLVSSLQKTTLPGWAAILYLAIVSTIIAYLAWYYALKRVDASQAAVYLSFIPLTTIVIAILLGERMTVPFFVGAGLIIYGVYLTQRH
jgi:drug/metabolite transporter (DMT)-like permease